MRLLLLLAILLIGSAADLGWPWQTETPNPPETTRYPAQTTPYPPATTPYPTQTNPPETTPYPTQTPPPVTCPPFTPPPNNCHFKHCPPHHHCIRGICVPAEKCPRCPRRG
ncbi:hypothetical protein QR680_015702 [Steinernema hermaphroditum]|uniref:Uncharacterized protein n=1 Tax=Steinernema hermaphroditum TaxID=289476 RepID=A0AA39HAV3_9BILA|nr:hypothetical protein QR680_015702 [Steinernema hermaphroditum]